MATVISQQPWWLAGVPEQRRQVADAIHHAHEAAKARRARVLAQPGVAARLCELLGYQRADQWNGYLPARTYEAVGGPADNGSARRAAIVGILHEVVELEKAAA